jgi:hypothetical protein
MYGLNDFLKSRFFCIRLDSNGKISLDVHLRTLSGNTQHPRVSGILRSQDLLDIDNMHNHFHLGVMGDAVALLDKEGSLLIWNWCTGELICGVSLSTDGMPSQLLDPYLYPLGTWGECFRFLVDRAADYPPTLELLRDIRMRRAHAMRGWPRYTPSQDSGLGAPLVLRPDANGVLSIRCTCESNSLRMCTI